MEHLVNKVGVIGWPVEHSLSPVMHNAAFAALGMDDWLYDKLPVPPDIVGYSLRVLRTEGGYLGVNVTVPLKQEVLKHVQPDETAQRIGAVNTIDFRENRGYNTDAIGFLNDLKAHGVDVQGANVIVIGAGGAARAAVYALAYAKACIVVVNRTPEKAQQMIADMLVPAQTMSFEQAAKQEVALVVNSTSAGMWPHVEESAWPDDLPLPTGATVYDMVYRPAQTKLMSRAKAEGSRVIGGLGMLVRQGAAAFELWTKREAPIEVMFAALEKALSAKD